MCPPGGWGRRAAKPAGEGLELDLQRLASATRWLFDSEHGAIDRLVPRWLFLRVLGFIYFSAFFSLVFQIRGLIGPEGILPANEYLHAVAQSFGYGPRHLVCAYCALAFKRPAYVDCTVLGRHGRFDTIGAECVAAGNAGDLLCVLPVFRECSAGFFRLSVGRHARSGLYRTFLRSVRIPSWLWHRVTAIAHQSLAAAMGMVSHLLRVRCREDYRWRPRVAPLYGYGRVLSERSAAHLDRLVCAASATLVSCFERLRDSRA